MILERATVADLDDLLTLEACFDVAWSAESWLAELNGSDRRVLLARHLGTVVGAACFQVVDETADLHRIVVAGQYRRRGIAGLLLRDGLAWAAQQGASAMLLEVNTDNSAAIALYQGFGFQEIALRRHYYGQGAHALVMRRPLADVTALTESLDVEDDR